MYSSKPQELTQEVRDSMSRKEQDLYFLLQEKISKRRIKRKLYINSETTYWRLVKNMRSKLSLPKWNK